MFAWGELGRGAGMVLRPVTDDATRVHDEYH